MSRIFFIVLFVAGVFFVSAEPSQAQDLTETVRKAVITAVKEKTGRTLSINGELSFSMQPKPHLTAKQVILSNPEGFADTPFILMEKIDVSFDLVQALIGNMVINGFVMEKPLIKLEVNEAGDNNWSFGAKALQAGDFEISNGIVIYSDRQKNTKHTFAGVNLKISAPTVSDPIKVTGNLKWNGEEIRLSSSLATLELFNKGNVTKINFKLDARQFSTDLSGDLKKQKDGFKFDNVKLRVDDMKADGKLSFKYGKARPYIGAELNVDKLDFTKYLGGTTTPPKTIKGWSKEVIDLTKLKAIDGDFKLSTGSVIYQDFITGKAQLNAKLKKGVLKLKMPRVALYKGSAKMNLSVDTRKSNAILAFKGSAKGVQALPFLRDAAGIAKIEGRTTLSYNLTSGGKSIYEIMKALRGNAEINLRKGALLGINIGRILRSVQRGKTSGFAKGGKTAFGKIVAKFRFRKGVGRNKKLRMSGGEVRISGGGRVRMANQALSYRIHPSLVGRGGISVLGINVPIIVTGPWANPQIYPDLPGFLDAPNIALKGLSTVGTQGVKGVVGVTKKVITPIGEIITAPFKKLF